MRRTTAAGVVGLLALALLPTRPSAGQDASNADAARGFAVLQEICRGLDENRKLRRLPDALVKDRYPKAALRTRWRDGLAARIAGIERPTVRAHGDHGVVRFESQPTSAFLELRLRRDRVIGWVLDCQEPLLVGGTPLFRVNDSKPAKLRLNARRKDGPYEKEVAFSFSHVTHDPRDCRNRMDVWYCHNGDLHLTGKNRITRVGTVEGKRASVKLEDMRELPVAPEWITSPLRLEDGATYVLHCRRPGTRDFYVKLRVSKGKRSRLYTEWAVLASGFGAPATIHDEQPVRSTQATSEPVEPLCPRR